VEKAILIQEQLSKNRVILEMDKTGIAASIQSSTEERKTKATISRLRSIARYEKFRPTALACSPPLSSSAATATTADSIPQNDNITSLGALAGSKGVALFRVSSPQTPLLVLSHASRSSSSSSSSSDGQGGICAMAFQPQCITNNSLSLAAARGNGILVWDVSGHSLNPLAARMGVGSNNNNNNNNNNNINDPVVSLAWYNQHGSGNNWLLAGATSSSAYLWDLRDHSSSSPMFAKPSLRFGTGWNSNNNNNLGGTGAGAGGQQGEYVQLACSSSNSDCALLDSQGTVRVFDIRMTTAKQNNKSGASVEFRAHDSIGIGLSYLPSSSSSDLSRWVTWGIDSIVGDPVVRIWQQQENEEALGPLMSLSLSSSLDTTAAPSQSSSVMMDTYSSKQGWDLLAELKVPNLACARVCAEDTVVTVAASPQESSSVSQQQQQQSPFSSWIVDLWKVLEPPSDAANTEQENNTRMTTKRLVSFEAGHDAGQKISSMLGTKTRLGRLCASELALSTVPRLLQHAPAANDGSGEDGGDYSQQVEKQNRDNNEPGVLLLSLTDTGFLTTHVIPEAVPFALKKKKKMMASTDNNNNISSSHHAPTRIYPDNKESPLGDIAGAWSSVQQHQPQQNDKAGYYNTLSSRENNPSSGGKQGATARHHQQQQHSSGADSSGAFGQMQFDLDVAAVYSTNVDDRPSSFQVAAQDKLIHHRHQPVELSPSGINPKDTLDSGVGAGGGVMDDSRNAAELMEKIETRNIPCPRLCGATFGPSGVGGLVTFHNGEVKKMWKWYSGEVNPSMPHRSRQQHATTPLLFNHEREQSGGNINTKNTPSAAALDKRGDTVRSLKDLFDMMKASKESHWGTTAGAGEQDGNSNSSAASSSGEGASDTMDD
jgi:hypothetical protein